MKLIKLFLLGLSVMILSGIVFSQMFFTSENVNVTVYVTTMVTKENQGIIFYNTFPFPVMVNYTKGVETVFPYQHIFIPYSPSIIYVTSNEYNFTLIIFFNNTLNDISAQTN
jgi:hypothetical protein